MRVNVSFKIDLLVGKEIEAKTLEEAIEKARSIRTPDIIPFGKLKLDWEDGNAEVTGAYIID